MNLRNRVQLIGNLGAAPVVKEFGNNKKMARFSVATQNIFKKEGKLIKDTQWHNIVAWDKLAGIAEKYLRTGTEVVIDGKLMRRSYDNSKGEKQYATEIIAESMLYRNKNVVATQTELQFTDKRA